MSKTTPETTKTEPNKAKEDLFADTNISMKSGHLTKDAELIAEGKFIKFRIAANKEYIDPQNGEVQTIANYFNVMVSANLTDAFKIAKDLKKGDWAYIKGEDSTRSIDTIEGYKDTGVTTFAYKVVLKKPKTDNVNESDQLSIDQSVNGAEMEPA